MLLNIPFTPREVFAATKILFYAILIGLLVLTGISYGLSLIIELPVSGKFSDRKILLALLLLCTFCLTAAEKLYNKKILAAKQSGISLIEKLNIYRAGMIIYLAICEGIAVISLIIYFFTENKLFLVVVSLLCIAMIIKRPEKSRIFNELQLSTSEQLELN